MSERLRVGLVLAAVTALCLPIYRGGYEPAVLLPLARANAVATAGVLGLLGVDVTREGTVLRHSPEFAIDVGVHCTAWIYLVLWVAGVGLSRRGWNRGWRAGALGLGVLTTANLIRLALVVLIGSRSEVLFDWSHRYVGDAALVATWLGLWLRTAISGECIKASELKVDPRTRIESVWAGSNLLGER